MLGYLLNDAHPYGAAKARLFEQFGFSKTLWEALAEALREHGRTHAVASISVSKYRERFEVEGELTCPNGRRPWIRTVWQIDEGSIAPRLITAYPLPRSRT